MVRDLRSILASFERVYRKNRHSRESPDNPSELYGMTVEDRINHFANNVPLGLAMQRLKDSFNRGIDDTMLFVRYEDLCNYPKEVMNKIYAYIEEDVFIHNFEYIDKEVKEDDSHFGIFGKHTVKIQIQPIKHKPWSDVFSDEQAQNIYNSFLDYNKKFNYIA